MMAFPAMAAILIGGATPKKASVFNVVQVVFLFCLIVSAFLVLYVSVFIDAAIDLAREKLVRILLA